MISWFLLVLAQVPGLVSLLFYPFFFPKQLSSWMWFSILARHSLCSIRISWFVLVPALVPALVSLLVSSLFAQKKEPVPS